MSNNIILEGLEFFSFHGCYEEERKMGNKFVVDLSVETNTSLTLKNDDISQTIDYTKLYAIVKQEMLQKSKLLEHIAQRIIQAILTNFSSIKRVTVSIAKHNPPIGGICRAAKVKLTRTFNT